MRNFAEELIIEWRNMNSKFPFRHMITSKQLTIREHINNTRKIFRDRCLHEQFFEQVAAVPKKAALVYFENGEKKIISYSQLYEMSLKLAGYLVEIGIKKGDLVGISMPKDIGQIIAVYGILTAGAAYVPIGVKQPIERKKKIIEACKIKHVVTSRKIKFDNQLGISEICYDDVIKQATSLKKPIFSDTHKPAYVIFTSGTTGTPKGVIISHREAYNTIADINEKFCISKNTIGIAISELDFDLSVYDIFGLLAAGGTLAVLSEDTAREPNFWQKVILEVGVNFWNSVPALFDMLLTSFEVDRQTLPLQTVLLSGDWIKVDLYERLSLISPNCKFVALGGATEASIWSNYFIVKSIDSKRKSIPYGQPLSNQYLRVVDCNGYDCPDFVGGELWIGGEGVADGYINDKELTDKKFIVKDGIKWYKTGDLVRFNSRGIVEFLGRMDNQVKINGYRIEIGEVEHVIMQEPSIAQVVVGIAAEKQKNKLVAVLVPRIKPASNINIYCHYDNSNYSDIYFKQREEIVRRLISDFCLSKTDVCEEYRPVIEFWESWLNYKKDNSYSEILESPNNEMLEKIEKSRKVLFDILTGKCPVEELLQREEVSPEYWSLSGEDTKYYLKQILLDNIKNKKIAVLGARTGKIISQYWNVFCKAEHITLFDTSSGMLKIAQEKLCGLDGNISYRVMHDQGIEDLELNKYDVVLAVNVLHTYEEPLNEIRMAALLLRENGTFYAVEYEEMDPIGILLSGLLENGFVEQKRGRMVGTPLLLLNAWKEKYKQTPFEDIEIFKRGKLGALLIVARKPTTEATRLMINLQKRMHENLPIYMIPTRFAIAKQIKLNKNGKIDRQQTLKILTPKQENEMPSINLQGIEAEIADIWRKILNCKIHDKNQNFFESGGDSISAARFVSEIKKKYDVNIKLKHIFNTPALGTIAALIQAQRAKQKDMIEGEV